MAELLTPVSKIKLPDGTIVPLSNTLKLSIPELCEANVTWNITNFTGTTSLISGTTADYLLTINEQPT